MSRNLSENKQLASEKAIPLAQSKVRGSLLHHVAHDFFSNSGHFPFANILLETLLMGQAVLFDVGIYVLMLGSLVQAWFLGSWEYQGKNRKFFGNLIGPVVYTLIEFPLEGTAFFEGINHWAYWGFSLAVGLFATMHTRLPGKLGDASLVLENLARTFIMLGMYWIYEIHMDPTYASPVSFFAEGSHDFFALSLVLFGVLMGLEKVNSHRRMEQVAKLSRRLGEYSEWLLGGELLNRALNDPESALSLQRRDRHVLFMDIRGFTSWSEMHSPEVVVDMLNKYFSISEGVWQRFHAVKAKYTGDEVMVIFEKVEDATGAAQVFMDNVGALLAENDLSVGIGIHCGPLMEGALGSSRVKAYDVIGDTVNTAKRLCDSAEPNEVLISKAVLDELRTTDAAGIGVGQSRLIQAKGKRDLIEVYTLIPGGTV